MKRFVATVISVTLLASACAMVGGNGKPAPLIIQAQGSFAVGGTVITHPGTYDPMKQQAPDGQTFHGDHAYVFYQLPVNARTFPLVLWHGAGQFSKTWETTPDGREGFQNLFLRRGFGVYVIDQPRRGNAGRSTLPMTITPTPDEQTWFNIFRIGIWPNYFPGVQFSRDSGGPEPVLPPDDAQHGSLRCGGDLGRSLRVIQSDRAGDSRHPFPRGRAGLGHRHKESQGPGRRVL